MSCPCPYKRRMKHLESHFQMFLTRFTFLLLLLILGIAKANINEILGNRTVKSTVYGTYLATNFINQVIMTNNTPSEWEQWTIQEVQGGKVTLLQWGTMTIKRYYLRADWNELVNLADSASDWEKWTPSKNADGSWSFLSYHNKWLSAMEGGSVYQKQVHEAWGNFWVGPVQ
ncbi:hypothetical protein PMAYCL1PPCAC_05115 [Pristionchus mayeri]|uniref:Uncharacterized protein n=1 Tax=Pristionchus mayeri TaxID=1317129 RepID=A0AAN4ZDC8_9BILA|nr:hypothetical protein PMAYCL1PPCAC_05115 [Pristionchus mayeri]